MKYAFLLLLLSISSAQLADAQSPSFCAEMLDKAKAELKKKEYGKSRDYCEAALPLCPDYADRFGKVLEEVNTAIEAEKKKAKDGETNARLTLKEADKKIYILDYEGALEIMRSAAALNAAQKEVSDALLEIAFFFAETEQYALAKGVLNTAASLAGQDWSTFKKLANLNTRKGLREAIKTLNPDRDTFLAARYFPTMILIPGGTDTLGSEEGGDDEKPRHAVTISSFKMAKTETTWWQYNLFCEATKTPQPDKPGWGSDGDNPVINVSWYDAIAYANWLSDREGRDTAMVKTGPRDDDYDIKLQSNSYRLPTEAEWEYATRAKKLDQYAGNNDLDSVGWYYENSQLNGVKRTHPVARKKANDFGLYDMSGNVWEWCWDWYGPYNSNAVSNPTGAEKGAYRVYRGGSWFGDAEDCRVPARLYDTPPSRFDNIGFRLSLQ